MDVGEKDTIELGKRIDDAADYNSSASMSSNWRFTGAGGAANSSLGLLPVDVRVPVCRGDLVSASSRPSASMIELFGPCDHMGSSQCLDYSDINAHSNSGTSSVLGMGKFGPPYSLRNGIEGAMEMVWHPSSAMLKGGIFLPNAPGVLPQSLSHIPADTAFIERAARFSCFSGENFSDMVHPFRLPVSVDPYTVQRPIEVFSGSGLSSVKDVKTIMNVVEASEGVNCVTAEGSPLKNDRRSEGLVRSLDEGKQCAGPSRNDSNEDEFRGGGGEQEELPMLEGNGGESSVKSLGSNKRKKSGQDIDRHRGIRNQESGQAVSDNPEIKQKTNQNPTSTSAKTAGKHIKQRSQASDPPKEDYIHVRACRGQATNSHSLAERVRREKISERMKFLQDLVPGCSKVTGKAVMLDEIVNYVQSLQRQVEFLAMKLATVNPRMELNIEGLLAKDILHSWGVSSSTLAYSPEMHMGYPSLNRSHPGLIPSRIPGMESHADILRRTMNTQLTPLAGGFKEPPQLPNAWDDELHNVVHLDYGTSTPQENQELSGTPPTDHKKMEL